MEQPNNEKNIENQLENIKNLIYKKYGLGALTVYARMHGLNYQELSNVLNGRGHNKKVLAVLEKEFKITISPPAPCALDKIIYTAEQKQVKDIEG